MKLWRVEFDFEMIVLAETEADAREIARDDADDAFRDYGSDSAWPPHEVESVSALDSFWRDSIPYGGDTLTCAQIMEAAELAERQRPPTAEELERAGQARLIA